MESRLFERLQELTPGSEKYRRILSLVERRTLSGVIARLVNEEDQERRRALRESVEEILAVPE